MILEVPRQSHCMQHSNAGSETSWFALAVICNSSTKLLYPLATMSLLNASTLEL